MTLALARVDDRLIHGQVVLGWGRPLGATFIVLVDDAVRSSEWEQELYRLAVPPEVEVLTYEHDIVHDDYKQQSKMTRAERLLCREFWRGQLHGSGSKAPVHARHMRSRCSVVPRGRSRSNSLQTR